MADSLLPPRLRGRTYARTGGLPGLEGGTDTGYRIDDLVTTAYAPTSSLDASLPALYHEVFHRYQRRTFDDVAGGEESVDPELLSREFLALARLERRMLARALELPTGAGLDALVRRFLAVRHRRLAGLPVDVREVERRMERREGSANLVGYQLTAVALGADPERVERAVREYLTIPLDRFGGSLSTQIIRWRAYGTGAAMGLLLDRKGVAWRRPVAEGASFDSLLAEAVAPDSAGSAALARDARAEFGYDELVDEADDVPTPAEELDAFHARAPARIVVEVLPRDPAAYEADVSFNFSSGFWDRLLGRRHGMSQPAEGLTLIWDPDIFHVTNPGEAGFDLRVEGRAVAMDSRGEGARYVVMLPRLPEVDGRRPAPGSRAHPDGLELRGEGLLFRTGLAAEATVSAGDSIRVRIRP